MRLFVGVVALVAAIAPAVQAQTSPMQRKAVVEALASALEKDYVYPDIGKRYAAMLREKVSSVGYAVPDDFAFAEAVQADLDAVNKDRHLRLLAPLPPQGAPGDGVATGGPRIVRGPPPGGVKAIEYAGRLTPDVAYIRFGMFPGDAATLKEVEDFFVANAGVKSLIVDARGHRGGSPREIDVMFSELFAKPADLVQMELAKAVVDERPEMLMAGETYRPAKTKDGFVSVLHVVKPAAHPKLAATKLYVLQSAFSGSAAEHLLLAVKVSGRGKLVGETSAGANHFGYGGDLPNGFRTFIPVGRTFDPKTGWDWEGKGVAPDVSAPAMEALKVALRDAGVAEGEIDALNAQVEFVMPQRGPGGGPVRVRAPG